MDEEEPESEKYIDRDEDDEGDEDEEDEDDYS